MPGTSTQDIDGNRVIYTSKGEGNPIVVFETGMGANMETWHSVLSDTAAFSQVFAYNRPGYGSSTAHQTPRSLTDLARSLRENLRRTDHNPPYVLVGHSAGGLYANVFARLYPDEVVGVVLIDASYPDQFEYLKKNNPALHSLLIITASVGKRSYEIDILKGAQAELKALSPFPDIPLAVLTAEKSSWFESKEMRRQWLVFQTDLAGMSSQSIHTQVKGSSHFIHQSHPRVVIQTIKEVVSMAKRRQ